MFYVLINALKKNIQTSIKKIEKNFYRWTPTHRCPKCGQLAFCDIEQVQDNEYEFAYKINFFETNYCSNCGSHLDMSYKIFDFQ